MTANPLAATVTAAIIPVTGEVIQAAAETLVVAGHREGGENMNAKRLFKHLLTTRLPVKRAFPAESLDVIQFLNYKCHNKHS